MSDFFQQYFCPYNGNYSLIIEDNGKVAYAYLMEGRHIISDVWLYNQQKAPKEINWNNPDDMPFLNPDEYVLTNNEFIPLKEASEVKLNWAYNDWLKEVKIYIRNNLIAILKPNLFPGFSSLVCKDGPLAKQIKLADANW